MELLASGFLYMLGLLCYCTQIRQVVVSEMLVTTWNLKSFQTFILSSIEIYHTFNGKRLNSNLYWCTQTYLARRAQTWEQSDGVWRGHLTIRVAPAPWLEDLPGVEVPLHPFGVWRPRWEPPSSSHSWEYRLQNMFHLFISVAVSLCAADSLGMDSTESPQMPAPMPGKNTHIVCAIGLFQPLQTHTWEHNITILSKEQHIN